MSLNTIFIDLHISIKSEFSNSPLLCDNFSGVSQICIQLQIIPLIITLGSSDVTKHENESLAAWSTNVHLNLRFIATHYLIQQLVWLVIFYKFHKFYNHH